MNMKRFLSVCLAAVLAVSCCACSSAPKTPAQAAEKMHTALSKRPCSHTQLVMEMNMTLNAGESGSLTLITRSTNDVNISQEPVSGYATAVVDVDYGGEKSQTVTENYTVIEEGALVSYLHSNGVWMRVSTGQTPEDFARSAASVHMDASHIAIDETVNEYEGKAAICLTTQIAGEALYSTPSGMLESIGQQVGTLGDPSEAAGAVDCSSLVCDARIYLDKATYLPIAEEMTFSGMSDVLNSLYAQTGIKAEVSSCTASAVFLSYETQEAFVLPQGAKEKAEKWMRLLSGEPDNGDGTFTIREGSALIDITSPDGFTLTDKGYDHVYFQRDDHREIRYTATYSNAEYLTSKIDQQLVRYGSLPSKISREQLSLTGNQLRFDAEIVGVDWQTYEEGLMYAWADLGSDGIGHYFIFIEVVDGYNDGLGSKKSADVTPEEFMTYLNGAAPSDLMGG